MNIACNIDDKYVPYCGIMLTSLFENNRNEDITIHIIAIKLTLANETLLRNIVEQRYKQKISFYYVGDDMIKDLPHFESDYISISAYFRCFLPEILPDDVDKVIYLDCDVVVLGSIKPLWDTDISQYALAAVEDMNSAFTDTLVRLCLPDDYLYFNSGVVLFNLDYWRRHNVVSRLVEWLGSNSHRIVAHDQDLLNAVLHDELLYLPHRWNMQEGMLRRHRHTLPSSDEAIDREMQSPVIVHFAGKHKPWQEKCINPYKKFWEHYTDLSPWRGTRPPVNIAFRLNRLTFSIQNLLGLRNGYRHISIDKKRT